MRKYNTSPIKPKLSARRWKVYSMSPWKKRCDSHYVKLFQSSLSWMEGYRLIVSLYVLRHFSRVWIGVAATALGEIPPGAFLSFPFTDAKEEACATTPGVLWFWWSHSAQGTCRLWNKHLRRAGCNRTNLQWGIQRANPWTKCCSLELLGSPSGYQ